MFHEKAVLSLEDTMSNVNGGRRTAIDMAASEKGSVPVRRMPGAERI